jgi:thioredoxin reductase
MSVVSDKEQLHQSTSIATYDVVVVGAGPYGLTVAAQMMGRGLKVAIFGKTLELWREHMPGGMKLRSHWWATNLSDPKKLYSFDRYFKEMGLQKCYPVPAEIFVDYALWFQKHAVPNVDETYVASVERDGKRFLVTLEDGRQIQCSSVVMAIGLYYYANQPAEYAGFPPELVSHSFEHKDFSRFNGKKLLVIGGGQSAVEYTALLLEAGASVHLVSRRPIHWLAPDRAHERSLWEKIKAPDSGIAPGWKNWILEYVPYLFYLFPQDKKDRYIRNHYNAAASDWLRNRVIGKASLHEGQKIQKMTASEGSEGGMDVALNNGEQFHVDHVMLATGYEVNLDRLYMIAPSLRSEIQTDGHIPVLSHWFESSVPGLYFIGLTSLRSFGPLFRFVVGAKSAGERVAAAVARRMAHARV